MLCTTQKAFDVKFLLYRHVYVVPITQSRLHVRRRNPPFHISFAVFKISESKWNFSQRLGPLLVSNVGFGPLSPVFFIYHTLCYNYVPIGLVLVLFQSGLPATA